MASKELLKAVREKAGLSSNYKLARAIGVNDQLVSRWERNLGIPDGMNMISLLEVSGMTPEQAREEIMKNIPTKQAGFTTLEMMTGLTVMSLTGVPLTLAYPSIYAALTVGTLYIM